MLPCDPPHTLVQEAIPLTARASGGPSRGADAPTWSTGTRDGVGAILLVLALGLAFRLIIAYQNPGSGFEVDLNSFQAWAGNLASEGLSGFYERPFFHDYTPGYLYVLYAVGVYATWLGGPIGDLIKIPPILADVAIGWLVWSMARELGVRGRAPLVAAALAVFNPISWFDSVVWGQVDSFGVVFLLLGLRELWRDRPERSAIFTMVAALIKPQLAILAFLVAAVTIRRALWPVEREADDPGPPPGRTWIPERLTTVRTTLDRLWAWERRTDHPIRIVTTGLAGFLTAVVLCWPFGLSVLEPGGANGPIHSGLLEQFFKTAGGYPYASVNAWNPWALAEVGGNGVAANGTWACDAVTTGQAGCEQAVMFGPVPALVVGGVLAAIAFVAVCLAVARRPERLTILVGLTLLAIAFFVLPTRVHERYLYPFFALGAILAAFSWRWRATYVVLTVTTMANLYVVLTTLYPDNPGISDWLGIGGSLRETMWVTIAAVANGGAAIWAFVQLRPDAEAALRRELVASGEPDAILEAGDDWPDDEAPPAPAGHGSWADPDRAPVRRAAMAHQLGVAGGPGTAAAAAPAIARMPTWSDHPSLLEVGPLGWFRSRLHDRPLRADRSHALHGEPPGRLDRLDLWVVVVLLAAILGLRMFRLAEPYQMHFDEVYHARTATEFLQAWRYGVSHEIYEWTHPHLAKYAMAGGIVAWGDDRVSATSELGVPVRDALVEPRREDLDDPSLRAGDRLHVVTGSELRSYDLATRELIAAVPLEGATTLALEPAADQLFVGTTAGELFTYQLRAMDAARALETTDLLPEPQAFGEVGAEITRLFATSDGATLIAATADDRLVTLDAATAEVIGTITIEGVRDLGPGGTGPAVTVGSGEIVDPEAAARTLAELIGGRAAEYEDRLASPEDVVVLGPIDTLDERTAIQNAIDDGRLAGLAITDVARVAVADAAGVTLITPSNGEVLDTVPLDGGAFGLALVTNVDDPKLFVTTGGEADRAPGEVAVITVGGKGAQNGIPAPRTMALPGPGSRVAYDDASQMVHVLGATPDGEGWTIYVIEPHANPGAVYADAVLPFEPVAWGIDTAKPYPSEDRQQILAFDADGSSASVEIGRHAFAWRMPGMIAGALMGVLLYLLARILFQRRAIGLIVAVLVLADGMFFVQSRIGMNDAYVGLGIIAAYTLFAAIWTGVWQRRGAFWIAMPLIGVALGFAFASKWVALYAIGGLGILILARSALGRLLLIAGLIGLTTVLGYLAINVAEGTGFGNLTFVAIMVGLTAIAVVVNVLHPIAWSLDELRAVILGPAVLGALVLGLAIATGRAGAELVLGPVVVGPLHLAVALVGLSGVAYAGVALAARAGFGPLAPPPDPTDPSALLPPPAPAPTADWLRPGAKLGLPLAWMAACLLAIPLALYVVSYLPWAFVENHRITATWPPGHTGQTLTDLTGAMYAYHNNLGAGHAASSPWWAWPLNLKPVWFYQEGLAGSTTAAVYDAGNIVLWWLGIPAMAFVAWQAYRRRSLALALIAIAFACQWLSWARIDRAAFQYHYYTSLPFVVLALGYFLAELWHGASRRTWLLARLAAGIGIVGPALMWVFARPLCGLVGVDRAVTGSRACPPLIPEFLLTSQTLALAAVVGLAVLFVLRQLGSLEASPWDDPDDRLATVRRLAPLGLTAGVALVATGLVRLLPDVPILVWEGVPVEPVALLIALPFAFVGALVAVSRDARRFVVGALATIVAWFLVLYPNIAALPLPTAIANMYQGVLPTYLYDFQFPVAKVERATVDLLSPVPLILGAALVLLAIALAYSAWVWRLALAEADASRRDAAELGEPA